MWWLFLLCLSPALGFLNREPTPPALTRNTAYEEHWVNVRLNHFDATVTDTFPMRFYFNRVNTTAENIVIFVGGEWAITPGWVTGGLGFDLAEILNASLFYTEHRYYGLTRPTNGTSFSDLRHLTVDQALADLAQVIHYLKSDNFENGRYSNAKVTLVGCSYAGTMATWMRLSYPHLVDAAFSDSGPVHGQADFPEYLEVVGDALIAQGGQACFDSVQESMAALSQLLTQANGLFQVSQLFNTCTQLSSLPLDQAAFHWFGVLTPFALLTQNAMPGDVSTACAAFTNSSITNPVERLAAWTRSRTNSCVETRYTEIVNVYANTSFDSPISTSRAWFYQTCVEYGWYQTTSGTRHPFGSVVPITYFQQMCQDFFSAFQSPARLEYGISRTNTFFGSRSIPDYTVTVQGLFDPWHPMGPTGYNSSYLTPVYMVPDISHCRTVYALDNSETEEVRSVKMQVIDDLHRFLYGVDYFPSAAPRAAASAAVLVGLVVTLLQM